VLSVLKGKELLVVAGFIGDDAVSYGSKGGVKGFFADFFE
jgi:hypothetical protein